MDVELKPRGCVDSLGTVLSLGLLPILQRSKERQLPLRLDEETMTLRDGRQIRWSDFTRLRATDLYYNRRPIGTLYELWHPGGRIYFDTHRLLNADAVVQFVLSHLPPEVVKPKK